MYQFFPCCFLEWSTCVFLVFSCTIKVVQCYIFLTFYTGKSKKISENILENTGISCLILVKKIDDNQSISNEKKKRFG